MSLFVEHGIIQKGKGRGSALGFPTINIVSTGAPTGIYAATVEIKGTRYHAAAFADPQRGILEAHLLDFTDDAYGEQATIELHKKIRDSIQGTDEEMVRKITGDVQTVREYFKKHP